MTVFEQYPKITLSVLLVVLATVALCGLEWSAKTLFGLGNVVTYDAHPLYGYRPQPNQHVTRYKGVAVDINNLSLRARSDWDISDSKQKVLFLGDSVTYGGTYISNEQLFSTLALKTLPTWEAGNAAVNGWGVSNVSAFITQTDFLPADVYVSVFPEGDFYRGINRIGGQPFWTRKPRFALEELFQYAIYVLHQKKSPPIYFYTLNDEQKAKIAEQAAQDLKKLDDYLTAHQKKHIIYISPSRSQLLQNAMQDNLVKDALAKHGMRVTYIADKLASLSISEKENLFHDEIHLSEAGHEQWAAVIRQDLEIYCAQHNNKP